MTLCIQFAVNDILAIRRLLTVAHGDHSRIVITDEWINQTERGGIICEMKGDAFHGQCKGSKHEMTLLTMVRLR
jgi:hypothetical protein